MTPEDLAKLGRLKKVADLLTDMGSESIGNALADDPECRDVMQELIDKYGEEEVKRAIRKIYFPD